MTRTILPQILLLCFLNSCFGISATEDDSVCNARQYGLGCRYNCPSSCYFNKCSISHEKGVPECHRGCKEYHTGILCKEFCPSMCLECNQTDGTCNKCIDGYYGETCNQTCDEDCLNGTCHIDGFCDLALKTDVENKPRSANSKRLALCLKTTEDGGVCQCCVAGHRGERCEQVCENCQTYYIPDKVCQYQCKAGYHGNICNKVCPKFCRPGKSGKPLCESTNGTLRCINGCVRGYTGLQCFPKCRGNCKLNRCYHIHGKCIDCPNGKYGDMCFDTCSSGCVNENCSRNGTCTDGCKNGYKGGSCIQMCPEHCMICKQLSKDGCMKCDDGYTLKSDGDGQSSCFKTDPDVENKLRSANSEGQCLKTTEDGGVCQCCVAGHRGERCEQVCENCQTYYIPDKVCQYQCKAGYHGNICNKVCPEFCRPGNSGKPLCESTNGTLRCINGCVRGYTGLQCFPKCRGNCKLNTCYQIDGKCIDCPNGKYGDMCFDTCSSGCVKENCSRNGICTDGCKNGYKGGSCHQRCPEHCMFCKQLSKDGCMKCNDGYSLKSDDGGHSPCFKSDQGFNAVPLVVGLTSALSFITAVVCIWYRLIKVYQMQCCCKKRSGPGRSSGERLSTVHEYNYIDQNDVNSYNPHLKQEFRNNGDQARDHYQSIGNLANQEAERESLDSTFSGSMFGNLFELNETHSLNRHNLSDNIRDVSFNDYDRYLSPTRPNDDTDSSIV